MINAGVIPPEITGPWQIAIMVTIVVIIAGALWDAMH